jgi:hypothetical protein
MLVLGYSQSIKRINVCFGGTISLLKESMLVFGVQFIQRTNVSFGVQSLFQESMLVLGNRWKGKGMKGMKGGARKKEEGKDKRKQTPSLSSEIKSKIILQEQLKASERRHLRINPLNQPQKE